MGSAIVALDGLDSSLFGVRDAGQTQFGAVLGADELCGTPT